MKSVGEQMAGSLRVATIYSVGIYEMSEVIKTFLKTYPKVNLHIEFSRANRVYEDCLAGASISASFPTRSHAGGWRSSRCPRTASS